MERLFNKITASAVFSYRAYTYINIEIMMLLNGLKIFLKIFQEKVSMKWALFKKSQKNLQKSVDASPEGCIVMCSRGERGPIGKRNPGADEGRNA